MIFPQWNCGFRKLLSSSFFKVTFWFPKWRSLKPWKGHLWVQTRSLWRTWPTSSTSLIFLYFIPITIPLTPHETASFQPPDKMLEIHVIKTKRPQTTALHHPKLPDGVDISWHYARARAVGEAPHLRDAASNSDNLGNLKHLLVNWWCGLVVWV